MRNRMIDWLGGLETQTAPMNEQIIQQQKEWMMQRELALERSEARVEILEQESAALRKKLQEAEDRAIRAEVALGGLHAALSKIAGCPCPLIIADCGQCVSCIARAALGVEASNERMINGENFKHWKKKPEET